jgi:hypothetical protein
VGFAGIALCRVGLYGCVRRLAKKTGVATTRMSSLCEAGHRRIAKTGPLKHRSCVNGGRLEFEFFEPAGSTLPAALKEKT